MELTNKRILVTVRETGEDYSLTGDATIDTNKVIISFNGSFQDSNNNYVGYFGYSENSDGKVSKNVYDIDGNVLADCCDFLDECVLTLKQQEI